MEEGSYRDDGHLPEPGKVASMSKRILFLTPQLPYPPQQGTAIRNYNLIAQVAGQHEVHLLSFTDTKVDPGPLRDVCASLKTVPAPRRSDWRRLVTVVSSPLPDIAHRLSSVLLQQELAAILRGTHVDVLQIEGLEMAQYGLRVRQLEGTKTPLLVFDAHNAEYVLQRRIFEMDSRRPRRWLGALYSLVQWAKLRRYEARVCRQVDRVVACSAPDAQTLARLVADLKPIVVCNGVDTHYYGPAVVSPAPLAAEALVFTGKMDFRPNVDAVLWFCAKVLPSIQRVAPQAHFYIVGKSPHSRLSSLVGKPGITITGFVEDPRPYIAAATVYVVPLLTGGGTRLKVLEAMAMGKPIVSTTLGCEGIQATPERDIVLADGAEGFGRRVLGLLGNGAERLRLGREARAFVEQHFSWETVTAPLERAYER